MSDEGSVFVDGVDGLDDVEQVNNQDDPESGETENGEQGQQGQDENQDNAGGEGGQKTDKGTKLDPNPMSALNQRLANAERSQKEYEALLSDPAKVKAYLAELEREMGVATDGGDQKTDQKPRIEAKDIKSREDLVKFAEQVQSDAKAEIENVKKQLQGFQGQQATEKTLETISAETRGVQEKYPALREKNADGSDNPDFDPGLDKIVGEFFLKYNYDQKSDTMKNNIPMSHIADVVMSAYQLGQKTGSSRTNTQIVDKRNGRNKSGQGGNAGGQTDETNLTASQTIAQRIKRAAEARR